MKKTIVLLVCILATTGCLNKIVDESVLISDSTDLTTEVAITKSDNNSVCYYWYRNEKIYLPISEDNYFAIFKASVMDEINTISLLNTIEFEDCQYQTYTSDYNDIEEEYLWAKINFEIANAYSDEIVYIAPYLIGASAELGVTNRFYIKLKSENDYNLLEDFASDNGAAIVNENFLPLWYALVCTNQSTGNALTLSNKAYESGLFDKTDISFVGNFSWDNYTPTFNDIYYPNQWNLYGEYGINHEAIHTIIYGSALGTVAVVDSGVWLDHPDLNIYTSWDAVSQTTPARVHSQPNGTPHTHGTEMTGIIGATPNNNEGIVGIDPGLGLMPISIGYNVNMLEIVETAIKYAADHGAKVISNSYSYVSPKETIDAAFQYAIDKGCIMVQSAGNTNYNIPLYPYASMSEVISVGATTIEGERWEISGSSAGSTYGDYLDVVAPGENITTTTVSSWANDYKNYNSICTGTSPACPHVAATAGLILSLNPRLTRQHVTDIIESTARKLPHYDFITNQAKPNGPWNSQVGYGLVNPVDALRLAQGYYKLIEFDYSNTYIELTLTANKDVAIIWDWDTNDITEVPVSSSTTCAFTHRYATAKTRRICIAEKIDFNTDDFSYYSNALTKFNLLSGESVTNIDIKPNNCSLEYIRIQGGADIVPQTILIKNLPSLTDLYLIHMKDVDVEIKECPSLVRFGSKEDVFRLPEMDDTDIPIIDIENGAMNPDFVGDKFPQAPSILPMQLPSVPESITSFNSLCIENSDNITEICLENVNITNFDFSNLSRLKKLYISSHEERIVGGSHNGVKGEWLTNSIATLLDRSSNDKGMVVIRAINSTNTHYVNAVISPTNIGQINTTYGSAKNWDIIWAPGFTIQQ